MWLSGLSRLAPTPPEAPWNGPRKTPTPTDRVKIAKIGSYARPYGPESVKRFSDRHGAGLLCNVRAYQRDGSTQEKTLASEGFLARKTNCAPWAAVRQGWMKSVRGGDRPCGVIGPGFNHCAIGHGSESTESSAPLDVRSVEASSAIVNG